jgi:hypothetical protein
MTTRTRSDLPERGPRDARYLLDLLSRVRAGEAYFATEASVLREINALDADILFETRRGTR